VEGCRDPSQAASPLSSKLPRGASSKRFVWTGGRLARSLSCSFSFDVANNRREIAILSLSLIKLVRANNQWQLPPGR